MRATAYGAVARRFEGAPIDTARARGLAASNPALAEGRTIFRASVTPSLESPRFLVSGANNPKLGAKVIKGPRAGWPIFHLTLEERATCPRSCHAWSACYGNSMPLARRHTPDADFLEFLEAEIITVARQYPKGLLIRLHTLGDFYSLTYVRMWLRLMVKLPQLHVFGYTARSEDVGDDDSRAMAALIRRMTDEDWERFAIRFSRAEAVPQGSMIVDQDPGLPDVIVCPAQTKKTEACASCGLCWAEAARDKTIAFLRHGMKSGVGVLRPRQERAAKAPRDPIERGRTGVNKLAPGLSLADRNLAKLRAALPAIFEAWPSGATTTGLAKRTGLTNAQVGVAVRQLHREGVCIWKARPSVGGLLFRPGHDAPKAPDARHRPPAPLRSTLPSPGPRPVSRVIPVAARGEREGLGDILAVPFQRHTIRRVASDGALTRRLMGDPEPGRLTPSEMGAADIARHNAALLARLRGGPPV
jgi:hypothetical protein